MKLKSSFITHEVANEHITVATGNADFSGLVRSNSTAAFIIEALKNETTVEAIAGDICKEYDADIEVVTKDVENVIEKLRGIGAIDE